MKTELEFLTVHDCRVSLTANTAVVPGVLLEEVEPDFLPVACARASYGNQNKTGRDPSADIKLMQSLAKNKHTGPFEHVSATFLAEVPIFVLREWHRHRTQSYSEISMRYVTKPSSRFWVPDKWRSATDPTGNKQGSGAPLSQEKQDIAFRAYKRGCEEARLAYCEILNTDASREQARAVLPVGMISTMFATANLLNWYRFWKLRNAANAMFEIQVYARRIGEQLGQLYPSAWGALTDYAE